MPNKHTCNPILQITLIWHFLHFKNFAHGIKIFNSYKVRINFHICCFTNVYTIFTSNEIFAENINVLSVSKKLKCMWYLSIKI